MGRRVSDERMVRAERPTKREMAERARPYTWPENSRRHERFDYHNHAGDVGSRDRALHKMRIGRFNLSNVSSCCSPQTAELKIFELSREPPMTYV